MQTAQFRSNTTHVCKQYTVVFVLFRDVVTPHQAAMVKKLHGYKVAYVFFARFLNGYVCNLFTFVCEISYLLPMEF